MTKQVSQALTGALEFVRKLAEFYAPAYAVSESDTILALFAQLRQRIDVYVLGLVDQYASLPTPAPAGVPAALAKHLHLAFPLIYHIKNAYDDFFRFVLGQIVPFVGQRIVRAFPQEYARAIWMIASTLFLSLAGLSA